MVSDGPHKSRVGNFYFLGGWIELQEMFCLSSINQLSIIRDD
jgi:hypothetical protein